MATKTAAMGKVVPDFQVESSSGESFRLKDARGEKVVLYFYPKDNTPGCTLEGQEFNKLLPQFKKLKTRIYGISRDSLKSHGKFIESCGFKFDLLSDPDEELCGLFDVIKEKNMYGKKVLGVERSTFVIDEDGKLVAEWRKVKAAGHAAEVLEKIKSL
ncbi:MAG: peroxiredoxin [Bdellovibrionaceae bacterium]|nr:peroxiredoxin [Pseudobdellovibrionaceae bacterium]